MPLALCLVAGCWNSSAPDGSPDGSADDGAAPDSTEEVRDAPDTPDAAAIETWAATLLVFAPRGYATDFIEQPDGDFSFVGYSAYADVGFGDSDAWVARLDAGLHLLWSKFVGGPGAEWVQAIAPAPAGGIVLAGSDRGDVEAVWVTSLDRDGTLVRDFLLDGPEAEGALAITPLADGGYAIGGSVGPSYSGADPWVARLDAELHVVWQRRYRTGVGPVQSLSATADGDLLAGAVERSSPPTGKWLARLDGAGRVVWQRLIGDGAGGSSNRVAIAEMSDGDVVAVFGGSYQPASVTRLRSDGSSRWQKSIGADWVFDVLAGDDGRAIVGAGTQSPPPNVGPDIWMLALSPDGRIDWQTAWDGGHIEIASVLRRGRDGSLLALSAEAPSWLVKVAPDGHFHGPCPLVRSTSAAPTDADFSIADPGVIVEDTSLAVLPGNASSIDVPCAVELRCPD